MESYRKQLIQRFWEERRLTNPHLTMLYDLTSELIRKSHMEKEEKEQYRMKLNEVSQVRENDWHQPIHVYSLDSYYHRNIHNNLQVEVDTTEGITMTVQRIDFLAKRMAAEFSEIVSDIADHYYLDYSTKSFGGGDAVAREL